MCPAAGFVTEALSLSFCCCCHAALVDTTARLAITLAINWQQRELQAACAGRLVQFLELQPFRQDQCLCMHWRGGAVGCVGCGLRVLCSDHSGCGQLQLQRTRVDCHLLRRGHTCSCVRMQRLSDTVRLGMRQLCCASLLCFVHDAL